MAAELGGLLSGAQGQGQGRIAAPSLRRGYWQRTLRLSIGLLTAWLLLTLAVSLWLPHLALRVFGWPLGFWAASQGALGLYVLIVWVYAWGMDRLDAEHESEG